MKPSALSLTQIEDTEDNENTEEENGLRLAVPEFPPGEPPPDGAWEPLLAELEERGELPVYCRERLIRCKVKDESTFRRRHPQEFVERGWFLAGSVRRAEDGSLWAEIKRILAARHLKATAGSFEFGPHTWSEFLKELEARGEICMGWLHTHSLENLAEIPGATEKRVPQGGGEAPTEDPAARAPWVTSGLFLSSTDIHSAWKRGFAMPHHLTCVLDSDACLKAGRGGALANVLGVWGWAGLRLRRRSIHIVRDR